MADLLSPFAGDAAPEIAGLLRQEFGSLSSALRAPTWHLRKIARDFPNECELMIAARNLIDAARHEKIVGTPVNPRDCDLVVYLQTRLCSGLDERLLIIFCDSNQRYILDEEMGWGSRDSIRVDTAHLVHRATTVGAKMLLLAHNHPSGQCFPSEQDIRATEHLMRVAQAYDLTIVDHLIVTSDRSYSMRDAGQM